MSYADMVREFHTMVGQPVRDKPQAMVFEEFAMRHSLLKEEWKEYKGAVTLDELIDALGDMIYVIIGTMLAFGVDPDKVMDEIHRSNMTKKKGNKRDDGKILKDRDFSPPDFAKVLGVDSLDQNVIESHSNVRRIRAD